MSRLSGQRYSFGRATAPFDNRMNASVGRLARTTDPGIVRPVVGDDARVDQLQGLAGDVANAAGSVASLQDRRRAREQRREEQERRRQEIEDQQMRGDLVQDLWQPLAEFRTGVVSGDITVDDPIAFTAAWAQENAAGLPDDLQQEVQAFARQHVFGVAMSSFERRTREAKVQTSQSASRALALAPMARLGKELEVAELATGMSREALLDARMQNAISAGDIEQTKALTALIGPTEQTASQLRAVERQRRRLDSQAQSDLMDDTSAAIAAVREAEPDPDANRGTILGLIEDVPDPQVKQELTDSFNRQHSRDLHDKFRAESVRIDSVEDLQSLSQDIEDAHASGRLRDADFASLFSDVQRALTRAAAMPAEEDIDRSMRQAEILVGELSKHFDGGTARIDDIQNAAAAVAQQHGLELDISGNRVGVGVLEMQSTDDLVDAVRDSIRDRIASTFPVDENTPDHVALENQRAQFSEMARVSRQSGLSWPEWERALSVGIGDLDMDNLVLTADQQARFVLAEALDMNNAELLNNHAGVDTANFYRNVNKVSNLLGITPETLLRRRVAHARDIGDLSSAEIRHEARERVEDHLKRSLIAVLFGGGGKLSAYTGSAEFAERAVIAMATEFLRSGVPDGKSAVDLAVETFNERFVAYKGRAIDTQALMHDGKHIVSSEMFGDIDETMTSFARHALEGTVEGTALEDDDLGIAVRGGMFVVVDDNGLPVDIPGFQGLNAHDVHTMFAERGRLSREYERQRLEIESFRDRVHQRPKEVTNRLGLPMSVTHPREHRQIQAVLQEHGRAPRQRGEPRAGVTPPQFDPASQPTPINQFPEHMRPMMKWLLGNEKNLPMSEAAFESAVNHARKFNKPPRPERSRPAPVVPSNLRPFKFN